MTGLGVKTMATGDVYDGEWLRDKAHGWGIKYFANGDFHEGEYVCDRREGHGMYKWHNGDQYEGNWKRGEQAGFGCYSFQNGDYFHGQWERGRKSGVGLFEKKESSKRIYIEFWVDGTRLTRQIITEDDKIVYFEGYENGNDAFHSLINRIRDESGVNFVLDDDDLPEDDSIMETSEEEAEVEGGEENADEGIEGDDSEAEGGGEEVTAVILEEANTMAVEGENELDREDELNDESVEVVNSSAVLNNSVEDSNIDADECEEVGALDYSEQANQGAPPSGIDSGPSFQLGHDVSQILSVDEHDDEASNSDEDEHEDEDDEDDDIHDLDEGENSGAHSHNSSSIGDLSVDMSVRYRNPKRNLSEVKLTDLSRGSLGSCGSPVQLKQRLQMLRDTSSNNLNNNSIEMDESSMLSDGLSSLSIVSPVRNSNFSGVDDDEKNDVSSSSISFTFQGTGSPRKSPAGIGNASGGGKGSPLRLYSHSNQNNSNRRKTKKKSTALRLDLDGSL
jgi:hypothetical protein